MRVELSISCRDLADKDLFSKSDPMCVVFMRSVLVANGQWIEVARTEEIRDNLNPDFATPIVVEYRFEEVQYMRFVVVDIDDVNTKQLNKHDFLGEAEIELSRLVTNDQGATTLNLKDQGQPTKSTITIKCEQVVESQDEITLQFSAESLPKSAYVFKPNPVLLIQRSREDGSWIPVYRTEMKTSTTSPVWDKFKIELSRLCGADEFRPLRISCLNVSSNGSTKVLGTVETTLRDLTIRDSFVLTHPNKSSEIRGILKVRTAVVEKKYSFLEYIMGGTEIRLMVAIDLTRSNGDPNLPGTLHYAPPGGMSDYEKAIRAVGNIIAAYDSDNIFPVVGFGAKFLDPSTGRETISHCLNLAPTEDGVEGVDGIIQAYRSVLPNVQLWGPTVFAQVIRWAASKASEPVSQSQQHFTILLIITDGVITDLDATKAEIIQASSLPMCIIIVGVGAADFDAMDQLDSDEQLLSFGGHTAVADIVQFVPFRDFVNQPYEALAKHTLEEVPGQLTTFMKSKNIVPNPRPVYPST
eukprot:c10054_g1_i1.p1 GENE.c10054_g1_i1~~c10054_g1_i1.p1  ORF type:complete len:573 (-),score=177.08 c10054_g1_i1:89-1663(-)